MSSEFRIRNTETGRSSGKIENTKSDDSSNPGESRDNIRDFDFKRSSVLGAAEATRQSVINENLKHYDAENLKRVTSEDYAEKIQIENQKYFVENMKGTTESDKPYILGYRNPASGEIRIKDSEDINRINHIATHEIMHDLSFNGNDVKSVRYADGQSMVSETRYTDRCGIRTSEFTVKNVDGRDVEKRSAECNRTLNEGITENRTIQEMKKRGETPNFECYQQNVQWAQILEAKAGKDSIDKAYFGGDIQSLSDKINNLSDDPKAWETLNYNMDQFSKLARSSDMGDIAEARECRERVDMMLAKMRSDGSGLNQYLQRRLGL